MYPHVLNKVCFAAVRGGPKQDGCVCGAGTAGLVPQASEMGIPEEYCSFGMLFCVHTREVAL